MESTILNEKTSLKHYKRILNTFTAHSPVGILTEIDKCFLIRLSILFLNFFKFYNTNVFSHEECTLV